MKITIFPKGSKENICVKSIIWLILDVWLIVFKRLESNISDDFFFFPRLLWMIWMTLVGILPQWVGWVLLPKLGVFHTATLLQVYADISVDSLNELRLVYDYNLALFSRWGPITEIYCMLTSATENQVKKAGANLSNDDLSHIRLWAKFRII